MPPYRVGCRYNEVRIFSDIPYAQLVKCIDNHRKQDHHSKSHQLKGTEYLLKETLEFRVAHPLSAEQ